MRVKTHPFFKIKEEGRNLHPLHRTHHTQLLHKVLVSLWNVQLLPIIAYLRGNQAYKIVNNTISEFDSCLFPAIVLTAPKKLSDLVTSNMLVVLKVMDISITKDVITFSRNIRFHHREYFTVQLQTT